MEQKINIVTILVAVLGAVKIVLQAFGIDVITDQMINDIANGVAALVTIFGVVMSHRKPKELEHPWAGGEVGAKSADSAGYNK